MNDLAPVHQAALNAWIATMDESSPVSTYQGSYEVPFQRWFKFKEAFSPLLVKRLIDESAIPVHRMLDFCGGCGTAGLTSVFLGVEPTVIEVNPFLVDVIRAKLGHYEVEKIFKAYGEWRAQTLMLERKGISIPDNLPNTFVEKQGLNRWIYPRAVMIRLLAYREALRTIGNLQIRRLFRVLLGSVLVEISNVVVNGKGRKYRESWESRQKTPRDLDRAIENRIQSVVYDITRFAHRPVIKSTVIHGDSRNVVKNVLQHSCAISSPPYPNSFDYTDIYNLELWVLGYINDRVAENRLRRLTIRSHVQRRVTHAPCTIESPALARALRRLRAAHDVLWDRQIPNMIDSYFHDLGEILRVLSSRITPGGEVSLIVADSAYAGVVIPVGTILAEIGDELGYRVHDVERLRKMKSSAQQGWKSSLREEVVRLRVVSRRSAG